MKNKIKNTVQLQDGRKAHSCGFGFDYWIESQKGVITPIDRKYYNKLIHLKRKVLTVLILMLVFTACTSNSERAADRVIQGRILQNNYPIMIGDYPHGLSFSKTDTIWVYLKEDRKSYSMSEFPLNTKENMFIGEVYDTDTLKIPPYIYYKAVLTFKQRKNE